MPIWIESRSIWGTPIRCQSPHSPSHITMHIPPQGQGRKEISEHEYQTVLPSACGPGGGADEDGAEHYLRLNERAVCILFRGHEVVFKGSSVLKSGFEPFIIAFASRAKREFSMNDIKDCLKRLEALPPEGLSFPLMRKAGIILRASGFKKRRSCGQNLWCRYDLKKRLPASSAQ